MQDQFKTYFQWRPVEVGRGGSGYIFPERLSAYICEEYARPAVYRWRIFPADSGNREEVYIGEAEILFRRARRILRATKNADGDTTDGRLRSYFESRTSLGKHVALEWLDFPSFEIEAVRFEARDLWDPFKRKCLENLALAISNAERWEILNAYSDPISKTLKKFLGTNVSAKRLREAVEQIRKTQAQVVTEKEARKVVVRARL